VGNGDPPGIYSVEDAMEKTNVKVGFGMDGEDFDPALVTEALGISPTTKWKKGDVHPVLGVRKFSLWEVEGERVESNDIFDQVKEIINMLPGKVGLLRELRSKLNLKYCLSIVIHIYDDKVPVIHFDSAVLSFLDEIGASIDIDSYISGVTVFPLPEGELEWNEHIEGLLKNMNIDVKFCIIGDGVDPDVITGKLGVEPTERFTWRENADSLKGKEENSIWSLSCGGENSINLDEQLAKIRNVFSDKIDTLNYIKSKYNLSYEVCAAASSYDCHTPGWYADPAGVSFLGSIGAELDIDFSVRPCDPPEF
jgi:hypothetical protein